jgi:aspartate/methionine/tyrosine aminotransferase
VIPCDCDDELNPDPDALAEAFVAAARAGATVRMVVVCNPGNPSGAVLPKAQLDRIATLCRDQARPLARPLPPPPLLSNPLPLLLPSPPALLLRSPRRRARTPPPQPRWRALRGAGLGGAQGAWLVSDETYEYFLYEGAVHHSPAGNEGVINLFSFSKSHGLAGWRVGYMA